MLYSKQCYALYDGLLPAGAEKARLRLLHEIPFFFFNYFLIKIFCRFKLAFLLAFSRFFSKFSNYY